ncbi:MAG: hypothetical protein FWF65_09595 [Bacteroidetes bacterium]|nr:hypothetical protein [Bacteroidota bacterium]
MKKIIIILSVLSVVFLDAIFALFAQTSTEPAAVKIDASVNLTLEASEEQFTSAETIKTGNKVTRQLEAGSAHWYRIYAKMSGTLVFETTVNADTDPDTDVDMELYYESEEHRLLAIDDDSRQDYYASSGNRYRVILEAKAGMTYYVKVKGYDSGVTGSYQLNVHYTKKISVLDGTVTLELSESRGDFHCIGMQFGDKNLNMGFGTYMEIKKRGKFYLMDEWKGKKYANMNDGIKDVLKKHIKEFYDGKNRKKRGEEVWPAFVNEGGLQSFIDFANEIIDDEFLNSPFNEIYGYGKLCKLRYKYM